MPPQTPSSRARPILEKSTTVKRRYQRGNQRFTHTATQIRQIERSKELEKRAVKLAEKDKRRIANRKKKEDKDAKQRDQRRKAGLPEEPKVKITASQQRLSQFCRGRKSLASPHGLEGDDYSTNDDSEEYVSDTKEDASDLKIVREADVPHQIELEDCFSSSPAALAAPTTAERASNGRAPDEIDAQALRKASNEFYQQLVRLTPRKNTADIVAGVSLSQCNWDFDIASDGEIEEALQTADREPSYKTYDGETRKRKAAGSAHDEEPKNKRSRPALSDMSPSKVNTRSQERSPPSKVSIDVSPPQNVDEILALIQTQDLDFEKENLDPTNILQLVAANGQAYSSTDDKLGGSGRPKKLSSRQFVSADDDFGISTDFFDDPFADEFNGATDDSPTSTRPTDLCKLFGSSKPPNLAPMPRKEPSLPFDVSEAKATAPSSSYSFSLDDEETLKLLDQTISSAPLLSAKAKGRTLPWLEGTPNELKCSEPDFDSPGLDEEDFLTLDV